MGKPNPRLAASAACDDSIVIMTPIARTALVLLGLAATSTGTLLACGGDEGESAAPPAVPDDSGGPDAQAEPADAGGGLDVEAGPVSSDPASWSGGRLSREVWFSGGISVLQAFVDTQRGNERCAFVPDEVGARRCLPISAALPQYLDAECTQLVGIAPSSVPATTMLLGTGPTCDRRSAVYELGTPLAPAEAARWFRDGNGACQKAPELQDGWEVRTATTKIPPSAFASVSTVPVTSTSRITRSAYKAEDGAGYAAALWDSQLSDRCNAVDDQDATRRCMPGEITAGFFGDDACTVYRISANECGKVPLHALRRQGTFPKSWMDAYAVGGEVNGGAWRPLGNSCQPATPTPTSQYATTPIPKESLVPTSVQFAGTKRIHRWTHRAEGIDLVVHEGVLSTALPNEPLWDEDLKTGCKLERVGKDVKCMPFGFQTSPTFRDAACTQPIVFDHFEPGSAPPGFVLFGNPGEGTFHKLGAKTQVVDWYYRNGTGPCFQGNQGNTSLDAFELGPAEPSTTFATFVSQIE